MSAAIKQILEIEGVKKLFSIFGDDLRCVGGCVRDALAAESGNGKKKQVILTEKEAIDVDFATVKTPDEVQKILREHEMDVKTNQSALDHGTIFAKVEGEVFEITTLRKDVSADGHFAEVEFITDWAEDASRRDLTVNAIYFDKEGKLYDVFAGKKDLANGVIRFIGNADERVKQDPARIIRFLRMCAEIGSLPMDENEAQKLKAEAEKNKDDYKTTALGDHINAMGACKNNAEQVSNLTKNRIAIEFGKLVNAENPLPALKLAEEAGIVENALETKLNLDTFSKLMDIEEETGIKASALCRITALTDGDNRSAVFDAFRVSSKTGSKLNEAHKRNLDIGGDTFNPNWMLFKHGPEKAMDLILLSAAMGDVPEEYVSILADKAKDWEPHQSPISGGILREECGINGRDISVMQNYLEQKWCASDFKLDKNALLAIASTNRMN
jgi:hypothetical protein